MAFLGAFIAQAQQANQNSARRRRPHRLYVTAKFFRIHDRRYLSKMVKTLGESRRSRFHHNNGFLCSNISIPSENILAPLLTGD